MHIIVNFVLFLDPSHPPEKTFIQKESDKFLEGAAKEAGKETVDYASQAAQDPQQAAANAQQQAQVSHFSMYTPEHQNTAPSEESADRTLLA